MPTSAPSSYRLSLQQSSSGGSNSSGLLGGAAGRLASASSAGACVREYCFFVSL